MDPHAYRHVDEMSGSHRAAEAVIPRLLAHTGPVRSAADVGGGDGGWLRTLLGHGAREVTLFESPDAGPHLVVDARCFQPVDLTVAVPPAGRYDLALCLECAEHLPPHRAEPLVDWLTSSAGVVLFSAAVPGQGGKGHVNERPPAYWDALFARRGFARHDVLRPAILHDETIPWWYRQNLFVYTAPGVALRDGAEPFLPADFRLVHRDVAAALEAPGLRRILRSLGPAITSAVRGRLRRG